MNSEKSLPGTKKSKRSYYLAITLILLSPLLLLDMSYAAGRVFYDDFEDGTTNKWSQDSYRNRCTVTGSAADGLKGAFAGSQMARCNWNGTVAWNTATVYETLMIDSVPYTNEIFYRFKVRLDSNVDRTDGSSLKLLRIFYWDGNQATYRDIYATAFPGPSMSNRGNAGNAALTTYYGGASGDNTALSSSWHTVEYYFNNATGKIKVWHDKALIRDNTVSMGAQKWLPFYLTSNFEDPHDATNYIYFDNIEIYSDAGTGAAGSMADATIGSSGSSSTTPLPPAPTNLKVQ